MHGGDVVFGCGYCANDENRWYGHVTQIGFSEKQHLILLQCPRCGALYENTPDGEDATRRLTTAEAKRSFQLFPGHELLVRPE
jgi:hypothetical protein